MLSEPSILLLCALLALIGFHFHVVGYEEPLLLRWLGEMYRQYCRSVPRWFWIRAGQCDG